MTTATTNSIVLSRVQQLENLFFKDELHYDEMKTYSNKTLDAFWMHMRRNINNYSGKGTTFSEEQSRILKWLELKKCNKKNCGCYIYDIPTSVAKGLAGPACLECKKRKIQTKINLRIQ